MRRGLLIFSISVSVAGCGAFLSAFGEDPEPDPGTGTDPDASSEANAADGGATVDAPAADATIGINVGVDAGDDGAGKRDAGPSLRVFVTSTTWAADKLGTPDVLCGAAAAGLPNGTGTWRAWISHPFRQATNVLGSANGPWRKLDGTLVAQDKVTLLGGKLSSPIDIDPSGTVRSGSVWTGTSTSGSDLSHCGRWGATDAGFSQGTYGRSQESDSNWTNAGTTSCLNSFPIYCFEVPANL